MDIFTKNGFLNIDAISKLKTPFKIIIGSRQIGKTYGLCKWLCDNSRTFIFMRRTSSELDFVSANPEDSPFTKIYSDTGNNIYNLGLYKNGKYMYNIFNNDDYIENGTASDLKGIALSLTSVAKIRGFNMSRYTDIMYDEFIPERHVNKIRNESDALFNAYETINSNRELKGNKPVNLWLLANSNNLDNPILEGFGLIRHIENMQRKEQIISVLEDRGISIIQVMDSPISKKKKDTALYKAVKNTQFSEMALNNGFSYNDFSSISSQDLRQYKPLCTIGNITILLHKDNSRAYAINKLLPCKAHYETSENSILNFKMNFGNLYYYYIDGSFIFDSFETKNTLLTYFNW